MSKPTAPAALSAVETIEEAVVLLRQTSPGLLLCLLLGGVPFWLMLLLFITDMSRDAYAGERLMGASLGLTILYLWKKCWESVFAAGLHALLARQTARRWTVARLWQLVEGQARLQFWGLLVRPAAYVFAFPAAWISAYYQNLAVLGTDDEVGGKGLSARAWSQAQLWPGQNHSLFLILFFFLGLVWINVAMLLAAVPALLKTVFAIETMASRNYSLYLNSTFFAATAATAYLLMTPLWRAAYVVRCFHGSALQNGADIRASLQALRARQATPVLVLMLLAGALSPGAASGQDASPSAATTSSINPAALDRSIGEVLERREFAWRARRLDVPRAKAAESTLSRWQRELRQTLSRWKKVIFAWLEKHFRPRQPILPSESPFQIPMHESVLYVAGAIVVGLLAWVGWRGLRQPRRGVAVARAALWEPDLQSPDLLADQLPEDGWMQLARDLVARGELRLALRAAYLASLASLGERQFVSIARHKSNLDYQRELRRRARSQGDLLAAFEENLLSFERAWYGVHDVTLPVFEHFTRNLDRMRAS